jgi:deazaflavin-dependent oxidoreductase (nitroreductase family)
MATDKPYFLRETPVERVFNRVYGFLVRIGIGAGYNYVLETRGRKSGQTYTTPVNLLEMDGRRYLVSARGETGWARNARAVGIVVLSKGGKRMQLRARELPIADRPPMLKEFLDRYAAQVQRFFAVPKGSPVDAFSEMASRAPVFELVE